MSAPTPPLPPQVADYLRSQAEQGDAYAAELLTPSGPRKGDVIWDEIRDEALLYDEGSGREGWWSAREGDFVLPSEETANVVLAGQLVHTFYGRQGEQDAEKVAAAYQLFSAVEWALASYELAERRTNPRTKAQYLQPVTAIRTIGDLLKAWTDAVEADEDDG